MCKLSQHLRKDLFLKLSYHLAVPIVTQVNIAAGQGAREENRFMNETIFLGSSSSSEIQLW